MFPHPPLIPDIKGSGARPYSSVMIPTYNPRAEYPKETLRGVLAQTFLRASERVVASVPNAPHWTMRSNLLPGRFDYQPAGIIDATHLRWFTVRSLHGFFTQARYRIVESKASAGLWMEEYPLSPWRWLPPPVLTKLMHSAAQAWPMLFGCQHVIRAEL
jgi:cellulose synthase/poly-beta-1,6-N-acetylglucosamine synthase-like glycosyltransferase